MLYITPVDPLGLQVNLRYEQLKTGPEDGTRLPKHVALGSKLLVLEILLC
jgi:hypothetical protein